MPKLYTDFDSNAPVTHGRVVAFFLYVNSICLMVTKVFCLAVILGILLMSRNSRVYDNTIYCISLLQKLWKRTPTLNSWVTVNPRKSIPTLFPCFGEVIISISTFPFCCLLCFPDLAIHSTLLWPKATLFWVSPLHLGLHCSILDHKHCSPLIKWKMWAFPHFHPLPSHTHITV